MEKPPARTDHCTRHPAPGTSLTQAGRLSHNQSSVKSHFWLRRSALA